LLIGTLAGTSIVSAATPPTNPGDQFYVYIPANAATRGPLQVLVTVHGMGGDGTSFCQNLISRADQEGWIIVSPTFHYQDNMNADLIRQDDVEMVPHLKQYLDNLPAQTGLTIRDKVMLYGFSRGAQIVHRFAEFYPEKTLAVALFAGGSYTLPTMTSPVDGNTKPLNFPFGVADIQKYAGASFNLGAFRQVPFFIGVGGADGDPTVTPQAWNPYIGTTRIARAQAFDRALTDLGVSASITVFPGIGHDITTDMRGQAMAFLDQQAFVSTLTTQVHAVAAALLRAESA
jgi:predicted esterase